MFKKIKTEKKRGILADEPTEVVADGNAGELFDADVGGAEEGEVSGENGWFARLESRAIATAGTATG